MTEFKCPSCEFVSDDANAMVDHRVGAHPPSGPLASPMIASVAPSGAVPPQGVRRKRWPFAVGAAAITLILIGAVVAAVTATDGEEPGRAAATSTASDETPDDTGAGDPSADDDEATACEVAGQQAADDESFDLEACSTLRDFRAAYRAGGGDGLSNSEAVDLLAPLCSRNVDAPLCEDAIDILLPPTPTTERPTTTTAPPVGTLENPIPAGTPVPANDWTFTMIGFEGEVDGSVAAANQFNDSAPDGSQWVRMRIRATYEGEGSGSPTFALRFNLAGQSGATYSEGLVASGSGADPGRLSDQPETYPGGTVEGWVYYVISDADAGAPILGFAPNITYTDVPGGVGFFQVKV